MIRPSEITWRNGLIIPIGLGWLAIARPEQNPPWVLGLGAGLTVAGMAMRLWSAGCLIKNDKLSTGGPYRFLRDPMYFGSMLCVSGLLTVAGNFGMLIAFHAVFHLFVMPRKQRQEGQRLLRRFGTDYANYVVSVSSLVPRIVPFESKEPTEFDFKHALVRNHEWGIWMLVLSVGAVLAAKAAGLTPWLKLPWPVPWWV